MFKSLLGKIESYRKNMTETAFGEPMTFSTVTIIPVARVTYGTCSGSQGEEERSVASTQPLGYIEMRDDNIRFISLFDPTEIILLGAVCAAGIFSVANVLMGLCPKPGKAYEGNEEKKKECCKKPGSSGYLAVAGLLASAAFVGFLLHKRCSNAKKSMHCGHHGNVEDEYISVGEMERKKKQSAQAEEQWNTPEVTVIDESLDLDE